MKPKRSPFLIRSLSLAAIATLLVAFSTVAPVFAKTYSSDNVATSLLSLEEFAFGLVDGQTEILRGVYVPGAFALQIEYQPDGDPSFVSEEPGKATLFSQAFEYGNIGILAHNTLSGKLFFHLQTGDEVWLIYGDGTIKQYLITDVFRFQALDPESVYSDFVDLATGETISTSNVFHDMFGGAHHITFQTCIAQDDTVSWGRLFVQAIPLSTNTVFSGFMSSPIWQ